MFLLDRMTSSFPVFTFQCNANTSNSTALPMCQALGQALHTHYYYLIISVDRCQSASLMKIQCFAGGHPVPQLEPRFTRGRPVPQTSGWTAAWYYCPAHLATDPGYDMDQGVQGP